MEFVNTVLLWLHFMGLAIGGAASFGIPVVGSRMASAPPESRPLLLGITHGLSRVGRVGLGLLIVTGPLLLWLKFNGGAGISFWFWIKMLLVLLLIAGVIYGGLLLKRLQGGDMSVAPMMPRLGAANTVVLVLIVLCAALTFG